MQPALAFLCSDALTGVSRAQTRLDICLFLVTCPYFVPSRLFNSLIGNGALDVQFLWGHLSKGLTGATSYFSLDLPGTSSLLSLELLALALV